MPNDDDVVYRIDERDKITFVNEAWDRHALEAATPGLTAPGVLARSLWDYVSDTTTRQLYRDMILSIRAGRRIRFPFRCDAPDARRFLRMDARALGAGAVEFRTRVLVRQERPAQLVLQAGGARREPHLRICGWCKKIPDGLAWVEIEAAVAKMDLFASEDLPALTHGICPECEAAMNRTLEGRA